MRDTGARLRFLLELQEILGGCIPFDRWMREALYHRDFGYYTANIREFGRRGDFSTWPTLNEGLGRALARWALKQRTSGHWSIIEIGGGSGQLAETVLNSIGWWNRPRYHIVEASPRLMEGQRKRLGSRAVWHRSISEALASTGGKALIISNELVDAFPCRIFRKEPGGWRELALRLVEGRIEEEWLNRPLPEATALAYPWPNGQRVEVHQSYRDWLREWLAGWQAGSMLTIDYGDVCPALYYRRPGGTLRAYAHHQRLEGPDVYAGFGLRDLTADVNFSDLQVAPVFSRAVLTTLGEFMATYDPSASAAKDHIAQGLGSPGGAGDAFKVLIQTR